MERLIYILIIIHLPHATPLIVSARTLPSILLYVLTVVITRTDHLRPHAFTITHRLRRQGIATRCLTDLFWSCRMVKRELSPAKAFPATAPTTQVMGQACHGLSQSSGMGNAPNQAPTTAPKAFLRGDHLTVGIGMLYLQADCLFECHFNRYVYWKSLRFHHFSNEDVS